MQADPRYDDVAAEVAALPRGAARVRRRGGDPEERDLPRPGIGFGKTVEHNFELVRRLDVLLALGRPVVVGFSRKSSLGRLLGDPRRDDRARRPRASAPPSPPTSAARRSSASTTSARTSRRSRSQRRCVDDTSSCTGWSSSATTACSRRSSATARRSSSTSSSRSTSAAPTTGSRTRSTTARSSRWSREVSDARRFELIEALAAAVADALLARFPRRARQRARAQAEVAGSGSRSSGRPRPPSAAR